MICRYYYGGLYYSYKQAVDMDCIAHWVFDQNGIFKTKSLAALLSTASDLVDTVGKQFAQPLKIRNSKGELKKSLLNKILKDRTEDVLSHYHNPDNDPRGPWQPVSANVQDGHAVDSQFYEIVAPNGKIHTPSNGRCWIYNKERMTNEIAQGNIWFGSDGNGVPWVKKFLKGRSQGVVPETLWLSSFVGTNKDAKTHLKALKIYDKDIFDTPKPETLIGQIIEMATNENELVMDAFLGSGTTISAAHKLNRNYIGIESERKTCDYVIKRMDQVVSGEKGGISKRVNWAGGGTYQFVI